MPTLTFPHLLSAGRIGNLELRNRIFMCPMGSNLGEPDGACGDRIQSYFEARARGGTALVTVGSVSIGWPVGSGNAPNVAISEDRFIPGIAELANRVHSHGGKVALQLQHAGANAVNDIIAGRPMLVPSEPEPSESDMGSYLTKDEQTRIATPHQQEGARVAYREATRDDIQNVVRLFADAAARASRAGIDAVEIHGGHGYLISTFISPYRNRRTDEYGGSVENRSRLLVEVIEAIKDRVGADFPVWCRLDATEFFVDGGTRIEGARRTAQLAAEAGADAIHVSAHADPARAVGVTEGHATHTPCHFVDFAKTIKKAVAIPVIVPGRIEPEVGDKLIRDGDVDFISMGRKLIAEPELANKLGSGQVEAVRPCIYCYVCISSIFFRDRIRCAVNREAGREFEYAIVPTKEPKKIAVVGGGPAGMEFARVATLRGHTVTLFEREQNLGGTAVFASYAYEPNGRLVRYLANEMQSLDVDVRLGTAATPAELTRLAPDEIVVATGARREIPPIPGANQDHVFSGDELRTLITQDDNISEVRQKLSWSQRTMMGAGAIIGATSDAKRVRQLSRLWMPIGKRVVIVGGGLVGLELAEFLAARSRDVTILEEGANLGAEFAIVRRFRAMHELEKLGVRSLPSTSVLEIEENAVLTQHPDRGVELVRADNVILAVGTVPNSTLHESLLEAGTAAHLIGDAGGIGYLDGAIGEASELARRL